MKRKSLPVVENQWKKYRLIFVFNLIMLSMLGLWIPMNHAMISAVEAKR